MSLLNAAMNASAGGGNVSAKTASAATAYSMIMQAISTASIEGGYKIAEQQGVFAELAPLLDPTLSVSSAKISEAFDNAADALALASSPVFRDILNNSTYLDGLGRASEELYGYYGGYDWVNVQYDVGNEFAPGDGTAPASKGAWMSPDGLNFAWIDSSNNIRTGLMATAYDLSTIAPRPDTLNTSSLHSENSPDGLTMKPDGTKLYFCGNSIDRVWQYSLSTPFDLSTATLDGNKGLSNVPRSIQFSPDGLKFFYSHNGGCVGASLDIAWDVVGSTWSGFISSTANAVTARAFVWIDNGLSLLSIRGGNPSYLERHTVSPAFSFNSLTKLGHELTLTENGIPFCPDSSDPSSQLFGIASFGEARMLEIPPNELQAPA
ncbi:MAG: hypothetical protein CMH91_01400 [Oceanicaulis sp.]|uniref:hypothetical protein n=1 Tax=unclassified Oceanicaulis TaxID=2632123 RepID=UPI000C374616|nr:MULTISPECIES: hypothetical protein [unclassified Oceanicaulis]MBC37703.1 hypothetical protein [Oceanicaulis sp.]MBG36889.1 hypothetical protein [Oceanicaulis sp.]|tara:strand:- start:197 stop:1330 length:1134 start_codon:yes stop_codon:yes gene_type:complete